MKAIITAILIIPTFIYAYNIGFCSEQGGSINSFSSFGMTPLMDAAIVGDLQQVKALIAAGANVNASKPHDGITWGHTALMLACQADGYIEVVKVLIAAGADVNAVMQGKGAGTTALHNIACSGNPEIVNVLLAAGANPRIRDHNGETAYDIALKCGNDEVARLLLGTGALNKPR